MAYALAMTEYPVAAVPKVKATVCGHIYNVVAGSDTHNGAIIKRGDWDSFDCYTEATATVFKGVIRQQASNGNWYVEVTEDGGVDTLFVYNVPIVEHDCTKDMASEKHFYNAKGDILRAHEIVVGDILEISTDGFSGDPSVGAICDGVSGKKPVVSESGESGQS